MPIWITTHASLSQSDVEIIDGLLLGDGSLRTGAGDRCVPRLILVNANREYVDSVASTLPFNMKMHSSPARSRVIVRTDPHNLGNNSTTTVRCAEYHYATSRVDCSLKSFHARWYPGRSKKVIPSDLKISPLALLHWFYGDGSTCYQFNRMTKFCQVQLKFATNGFSVLDANILKEKLLAFDPRLRLNVSLYQGFYPLLPLLAFYEHVLPIHHLSCFSYKFKLPPLTRREMLNNKILRAFFASQLMKKWGRMVFPDRPEDIKPAVVTGLSP